jgi:molybdenum-dependent DNA-binding transcriptional regulator ModE
MPSIRFRINLDGEGHIGPGKVELLEHIGRLSSIAGATHDDLAVFQAEVQPPTGN